MLSDFHKVREMLTHLVPTTGHLKFLLTGSQIWENR